MHTLYTKKLITNLVILLTSMISYAQVTQVKYYLTFNFNNNKYTVNMIAAQGNATSVFERQQGSARVTLKTTGTQITNITPLAPFLGNQNNNGTTPTKWTIGDSIIQPSLSLYALMPQVTPAAHYNNISTADTVALFSFETVLPDTCGNTVRLAQNDVDLTNLSSINVIQRFKNMFAFGNNLDVYIGNQSAAFQPFLIGQPPYCVGDIIQLNVPPGLPGTFMINNTSLGIINANNELTILAPGELKITFTPLSGSCSFNLPLIVANISQEISIPYSNICTGSSMQVNVVGAVPPFIGTWVSSNPSVLEVSAEGKIKALALGQATVTFAPSSGCGSAPSDIITVNQGPMVSLSGASNICIGSTTQFLPSSGGTWVSTNPTVLNIINTGVATGLSVGFANGVFTNLSNGCNAFLNDVISVSQDPTLVYTGNTALCQGETTSISANSPGTWGSNNPTIASINNLGIITGISPGIATFTFTNLGGCITVTSIPVSVVASPTISSTTQGGICIGSTKQFTSNTFGGVWISNNPTVASVSSTGLVLGISGGNASITYSSGTSGCTSLPLVVSVNARPIISGVQNTICVNGSIILTANTLGSWSSNNNTVAVVNQNGVVTGQMLGMAGIQITDNAGCISNPFVVSVTTNPAVSIIGSNQICVGTNTQLAAGNTIGNWTSSNNAVATVDNQGFVTGISAGTATFSFTPTAGGCNYTASPPVTVFSNPIVNQLPSTICLGSTFTLSPVQQGTWTSSNTQVIIVNANTGAISTVGVGTAILTITSPLGCMASTPPITVIARPIITLSGMDAICIGGTTQLTSTSDGMWVSSNPSAASVSNTGLVTGLSTGDARFTITSVSSGCVSALSPLITVLPIPQGSIADSVLCLGATTLLSPSSSGSWAFSNPNVATTTPGGGVTTVGAGNAFFIFTNSNGCSSMPVKLRVRPIPIITEPSISGGCVNTTLAFTTTPTNTTWTSSNALIATINASGVANFLAPGIVKFKATDAGGCVKETKEYTVNPNPTASITSLSSACKGETVIYTANGGISYLWANNATTQSITTMAMISGPTTVIVTDANGCTATATANLTVQQLPLPVISGPESICPGETIVWLASGGVSYAWSNTTIFPNLTLSPISTTSLVVTVSDLNGCSATATKTLIVHPQPIINISTPTIKIGESANLTANGTGTWTSLNTLIASIVDNDRVIGNAEGTAFLKFTDGTTGCMDTLLFMVSKPSRTDDVSLAKSISIIPNPSINKISVVSSTAVNKVEIYDLRGQLLLKSINLEVDISNLPSAVYSVLVFTRQGVVQKKLIKL